MTNESEMKRTYIYDSINRDFVSAHLCNIDLYRPLVQSSFIFIMFMWMFPECDPAFADYFYPCVACSFAQMACSIYWFHVSFYSENNKCWDKMGWYFHTMAAALNFIVIPIYLVINMARSFSEEYHNVSPYQLLFVFYCATAVTFSIRMLYNAKKIFYETHIWYRNRHGNGNKVKNTNSSFGDMSECSNDLPFLDI